MTLDDTTVEFQPFPKMSRLSREIIITEKIDGTNAQVFITEDRKIFFGSRTRWITPENDNYGFARWATERREDLLQLGPGRHFGEWWGGGIQRGYGRPKGEKWFSLFNVSRWCLHNQVPQRIPTADPRVEKFQEVLPPCVRLVPVLYRGLFDTRSINDTLTLLETEGSRAVPGFLDPEGIVVFHTASGTCFKKTIKNDSTPKSLS